MFTDYFSKKIARGKAFFDRDVERRKIIIDIASSSSVWLSGERRIGKTSIATYACNEIANSASDYGLDKLAWSICDISTCATLDSAQRKVLHAISEATSSLIDDKKSLVEDVKSLFARFDPEIALGGKDLAKLSVKLKPSSTLDAPLDLAIRTLDLVAKKCNSRVCIIVDEFQTLLEIDAQNGELMEWEIRSGLQHAENVCMIFTGSKRRMMNDAFSNQSRALYGMCRRIDIFDLPEAESFSHLTMAAKDCDFTYDDGALELIHSISKGHPRDFAHLSLQAFENATFDKERPKHITQQIVLDAWDEYINMIVVDEVKSIIKEKQAANKRSELALLTVLSHVKPRKIRTADFAVLTGFATTTIVHAIKNLDEQGLIRCQDDGRWALCEPSYEAALKKISDDQINKEALAKVIKNEESR